MSKAMPGGSEYRKNMIDTQLETGGVTDSKILDAFAKVPRERFLPKERRAMAYVDEDIMLGDGSFMMEPMVLGRMLQVAAPHPSDIALDIGDATGYTAALLSDLVTTIVALESRSGMFDWARVEWARFDFCNIAVIPGDNREGCEKHAPYNLIVINGAVETVPETLKRQLSIGGRVVTVVRERGRPYGAITLIRRDGENAFSRHAYYDAAIPYLSGFEPSETFMF